MKKIISIGIFLIMINPLLAQDAINWYKDWDNTFIDSNTPPSNSPLWTNVYNYCGTHISTLYDGEYLIVANDLPWTAYRLDNYLAPLIGNGIYITYQVELVSFPFVVECSFPPIGLPGGCLNTTNRNLTMPFDQSYNTSLNSWQFNSSNPNLYNVTPEDQFEYNYINPLAPDYISSQTNPLALTTGMFNANGGSAPSRIVLPHSILKHTLRLRCGQTTLDPIIEQIAFYTDLTRGMMREYPFTPTNYGTQAVVHDVTVMPGITCSFEGDYNQTNLCGYGETLVGSNDCGWANWKGNTINYTPFDIANDDNICTSLIPSTSTVISVNDSYFSGGSNEISGVTHLQIPSYSLVVSAGIRNDNAKYPAGYYLPQSLNRIAKISSAPFPHQYFIDKEIDLTKINPSEREIYNPSEVHVTVPLLTFPSHYTFKTIRAKFPYLSDILNENTIKNGGPYNTTDPMDPNYVSHLNVTTDLSKDWHVSSAYPDLDPMYSSIYHLDAPSKLIVQPCVRIFDATFEVNSGSEIVFENWSTNQINIERYNLLQRGGTITMGNEEFYLQHDVNDKKILHYKAGNSIMLGENVDPDPTKPRGEYKILSGSEVEYIANNFIALEVGFNSELGAFMDASIAPIVIPVCPPVPPARLRRDDLVGSDSYAKGESLNYFECSPNPITDNSVCMFKIGNVSNVTLKIYNSLGQLIAIICEMKQMPAGSYSYNLNKTDFKSGIYYAKLIVNNDSKSLKFIKS